MAVRAEPEEEQVERRIAERGLVRRRGFVLAELAPDSVHGTRLSTDLVEQRLLRELVIRVVVVRRNAPLVSPPELDPAPVGLLLGRLLVGQLRRLPAGQDNISPFPGGLGEPGRNDCRDLLRGVHDNELDVAGLHLEPPGSPRAPSPAAIELAVTIRLWPARAIAPSLPGSRSGTPPAPLLARAPAHSASRERRAHRPRSATRFARSEWQQRLTEPSAPASAGRRSPRARRRSPGA